MAFAPIPEYDGRAPYVFISYAQQDEKIAYAIAVKMYNEGFRLWSSAACGNPSNMRIAERLGNSALAMVFLSKSYLKFASYKEFEPRAVMNSPKQKIVICLDDTPMGTDWNTVDFPEGIRYNPDMPEGLWLRINSSDALEKCRGAWPKHPMEVPFEEKPRVDVSVDEEELTDEMRSLNTVMSSFGAGLDDDEIENISLFSRRDDAPSGFRWPQSSEPSQEQEYYSIENLIDNSPLPASPEKNQYDSMVGLIDSFMEQSGRAREEELQREQKKNGQQNSPAPYSRNTYTEYRSVPRNEFNNVDMSKDSSSSPVVITQSTDRKPITLDYGEETEIAPYSMSRNSGRAERAKSPARSVPPQEEPRRQNAAQEGGSRPAGDADLQFQKVVDNRQFIRSTETTMESAKLTYHLGSAFDGFDENDYLQDEEPPVPEPQKPAQPPLPEPVAASPARITDDVIPQPTLKFDRPGRPLPEPDIPEKRAIPTPPAPAAAPVSEPESRSLSKPRRRYIVSVRKGIRHIEYDEEMYEVNGRWIPGNIYHRLMPNAQYTAIRHINRPSRTPEPPRDTAPAAPLPVSGGRPGIAPPSETIPEEVRSALREKHEMRRTEAIRQYEENQAAAQQSSQPQKNQPPSDGGENAPARKHKFSHEGGIKKSLMAGMETPVNTEAEESHRQYGARAQAISEHTDEPEKKSKKKDDKAAKKAAKKAAEKAAQKKSESKKNDKKNKDKKSEEEKPSAVSPQTAAAAFDDVDEDSLIELPSKNIPNLSCDPSAYSSMNLSEILFGESGDKKGEKKKKKK